MYVCVFVFNRPALIVYYVSPSKRLHYPAVVYRGAVLVFCRCCHPTGRWLAALWAEKYSLIDFFDGCRLRVRSKAYSASSYKRGTCVGF